MNVAARLILWLLQPECVNATVDSGDNWRVTDDAIASRAAVPSSILGYAAAVAGLGGLMLRRQLFAGRPVSIAIQLLALLLMIWARLTFGRRSFHFAANPTAGDLVTWGPYRYWRHPIYAAIVFFVWAGVADSLSWISAALALVVTGGLVVRMLAEERLLRAAYPAYADYAARTSRLIPWVI